MQLFRNTMLIVLLAMLAGCAEKRPPMPPPVTAQVLAAGVAVPLVRADPVRSLSGRTPASEEEVGWVNYWFGQWRDAYMRRDSQAIARLLALDANDMVVIERDLDTQRDIQIDFELRRVDRLPDGCFLVDYGRHDRFKDPTGRAHDLKGSFRILLRRAETPPISPAEILLPRDRSAEPPAASEPATFEEFYLVLDWLAQCERAVSDGDVNEIAHLLGLPVEQVSEAMRFVREPRVTHQVQLVRRIESGFYVEYVRDVSFFDARTGATASFSHDLRSRFHRIRYGLALSK